MVLTDSQRKAELFIEPFKEFLGFLNYGIRHISQGLDHIFFLLLLIFSVFLLLYNNKPQASVSAPRHLPSILWNIFKLATAFTLSHSLTLALSVLNILFVPAKTIELFVIASIVIVGLLNIFRIKTGREWLVVFCFGLFHGCGFAQALTNLGLSQKHLIIPLVAFNIGIEIGQLIIIGLCLFPLYILSRRWKYAETFIRGLCVVITLIAVFWFLEKIVG